MQLHLHFFPSFSLFFPSVKSHFQDFSALDPTARGLFSLWPLACHFFGSWATSWWWLQVWRSETPVFSADCRCQRLFDWLEDEISLIYFVNLLIAADCKKNNVVLFEIKPASLHWCVSPPISNILYLSFKQAETEPSIYQDDSRLHRWLCWTSIQWNTDLQVWENRVRIVSLLRTFRPHQDRNPHSPGVWSFVSFPRPWP